MRKLEWIASLLYSVHATGLRVELRSYAMALSSHSFGVGFLICERLCLQGRSDGCGWCHAGALTGHRMRKPAATFIPNSVRRHCSPNAVREHRGRRSSTLCPFPTLFLPLLRCTREAGLYVILDLHGAPGSQNGLDNSGLTSPDPNDLVRKTLSDRWSVRRDSF